MNLRWELFLENLTYQFRREFVGDPLNEEFGMHRTWMSVHPAENGMIGYRKRSN
jgi:hypothetical protein